MNGSERTLGWIKQIQPLVEHTEDLGMIEDM